LLTDPRRFDYAAKLEKLNGVGIERQFFTELSQRRGRFRKALI